MIRLLVAVQLGKAMTVQQAHCCGGIRLTSETKERVLEWVTGPESCFLLGAGCSACANKPLIGQLTDRVLASVDASIKVQFDGLKPSATRAATIEDLINYLIRYQWILQTVQELL